MKQVTFTRDMAPGYTPGDTRLVPDDIAAELVVAGAVAPNPPSWPAQGSVPSVPPAAKPPEPAPPRRRGRDLLNQTYLTKRAPQ